MAALCLLGGCASAQKPPAAFAGFTPERDTDGNERLVATVRINDQPARLFFDTGARGDMILFAHALPKFDLKPAAIPRETAVGSKKLNVVASAPGKLEAFGSVEPSATFWIVQLSPAVERLSSHDGVLGWPGVKNNVWLFDLGGERAAVSLLARFPVAATLANRSAVDLTVDDTRTLQLHFAVAESGAARVRVKIDTGAGDGVKLSPRLWQECVRANSSAPRTIVSEYMLGDGFRLREALWAEHFAMGGLSLRGVPVSEAGAVYLRDLAAEEELVVLGLYALKRVTLVVDGAGKRAAAYVVDRPPPPFEHNRIGVGFAPVDGSAGELIARVAPGSPAARADVRTGDVLVSFDAVPAAAWWADPRRSFEEPAGTVHRFELRRGDAVIVRDVVAEQIFGPQPK